MARFGKDRGSRSVSIGPVASTSAKENAGGAFAHNGSATGGPNGNGTGAGDEFVYVPSPGSGNQLPPNMSWDVSVSAAGTMTALVVNLEGSDDGFVTKSVVDTNNSITGGARPIANPGFQMYRANIGTFTVNAGSPVVSVGITL